MDQNCTRLLVVILRKGPNVGLSSELVKGTRISGSTRVSLTFLPTTRRIGLPDCAPGGS